MSLTKNCFLIPNSCLLSHNRYCSGRKKYTQKNFPDLTFHCWDGMNMFLQAGKVLRTQLWCNMLMTRQLIPPHFTIVWLTTSVKYQTALGGKNKKGISEVWSHKTTQTQSIFFYRLRLPSSERIHRFHKCFSIPYLDSVSSSHPHKFL